jgi:hypothetical protein
MSWIADDEESAKYDQYLNWDSFGEPFQEKDSPDHIFLIGNEIIYEPIPF